MHAKYDVHNACEFPVHAFKIAGPAVSGPRRRDACKFALPPHTERQRGLSLFASATRATARYLGGVRQSNGRSTRRIGGHAVSGYLHKRAPHSNPRAGTRNPGTAPVALLRTAKTSHSPSVGSPLGILRSCARCSTGFRAILRVCDTRPPWSAARPTSHSLPVSPKPHSLEGARLRPAYSR